VTKDDLLIAAKHLGANRAREYERRTGKLPCDVGSEFFGSGADLDFSHDWRTLRDAGAEDPWIPTLLIAWREGYMGRNPPSGFSGGDKP
jgi:hypothetical protein